MPTDQVLKRYVELETEKRRLDDELDAVKKEMGVLESDVLEYFAEMGYDNVRFRDLGMTAFLKKTTRANVAPEDKDAAATALEACGYGDIIKATFNMNSLSALVRELLDDGGELPEEMAKYIKPIDIFTVGVRKS